MKKYCSLFVISLLAFVLVACDSDDDTSSVTPSEYTFASQFIAGESSVSYTGQTTRQVLIDDFVDTVKSYSEDITADVVGDLDFYLDGIAVDTTDYRFTLDGHTLIPGPTYGDISTGKQLSDKLAGNDKAEHLVGGKLLGWETGLDTDPTPEELIDYWVGVLATEVTDGSAPQIATAAGHVALDVVYVDAIGRDFSQLLQKFLLGAVNFSQGTADYLKSDFANINQQVTDAPYTEAEHKWDEAFGYFGAARDYADYTDDEIAGAGGRAGYAGGFYDSNSDGAIDLRSEYNFAHSTNCAKRDRGTANNSQPTDFTAEAFNAFLKGRAILNTAAGATLNDLAGLQAAASDAAAAWEKCIAATVVHYINDTVADIDLYQGDAFADLAAYKNLAKHWSEMKGFALSLQFNPESPFHQDTASLANYVTVLDYMGDAPVLPNGTQAGSAFVGGVSQYRANLLAARALIQAAYNFNSENVEQW